MQKVCNAGIFVKLPTKNAKVSQMAAVVMFGPTYLSPWATLSSSLLNWSCFSIALLMMNMLSTPMAKIKKGMTSALIIVNPIPKKDINPIEAKTDAKTIKMPIIAKVKPELTLEGNTPMVTPI
jgi:hypothetical protein